jgi:hypothetical protein
VKKVILLHADQIMMAAFGIWIFCVWRFAGMPSPGFMGRIIPLAWLLAGILNGRAERGKWFLPMVFCFTAGAWLWMLHPNGWILAASIPVAGLVAWGISVSKKTSLGLIRGILPILLLSLVTAEINGDEVRFAEQASFISGIPSERFGEMHFRPGDISSTEGHHTPLFPLLISPGLMAGDNGLRIVPVILALLSVLLLAKLTNNQTAAAAALLYPGFSVLGLAMTEWLALGLFTLGVLLPEGRKWLFVRLLIAIVLAALKMRYAGLAAGIIIAEYAGMHERKGKWLIPLLGTGTGLFLLLIDRYILNGMVFWTRYGNIEALRLIWVNIFHRPLETLSHAGWSLFDPEAGLFIRAPWVLAACSGLFLFRKNSPALFKRLFIPSMTYWAFLIIWSGSSWHGLPAPVGRMFLPMLPLFACGLASAWKQPGMRILIMVSIAVTAFVIVSPAGRYNYADGTDSILAIFGTRTGFSMVRSHSSQLIPAVFLAASLLLVLKRVRVRTGLTVLILFTSAFLLGQNGGELEAEDLPPGIVQGTTLYPAISEPSERYFWFNSRERMLVLNEPGQSILLRGAEAGDTLSLEMSGNGGVLLIGDKLLAVETALIEMPASLTIIGRSERILPDWPENRLMEVFDMVLDSADVRSGSVRIAHHSGPPVYIDRIGFSGESPGYE